jgi:mercuric ion binding protein
MKILIVTLSALLISGQALSADRTATFSVPNMTCALCPVTVETAMGQVAGVKSVKADFDARSAIAMFDDTQTSAEQLSQASSNAGYPAKLVSLK